MREDSQLRWWILGLAMASVMALGGALWNQHERRLMELEHAAALGDRYDATVRVQMEGITLELQRQGAILDQHRAETQSALEMTQENRSLLRRLQRGTDEFRPR